MANRLLSSFPHYCFHSHRGNLHKFPDLYSCNHGLNYQQLAKDPAKLREAQKSGTLKACPVSITLDMARQAGLVNSAGQVLCPNCGGLTTHVPGESRLEIHVKLCTDASIHTPEMHKSGKITAAEYAAWKATLTRAEAMGHYRRVPDIHVMATFTDAEVALVKSDPKAFNALMKSRLEERAENALMHQVPHRHQTTSFTSFL